ncbi:histone lysine demethylase PHF8 [Caerostris extrusa]|uniref:Histone lysine demethylase PHF8 n=1 Tax=Caerostris extrusa TaxID=172846 RepID=A0AAV4XJD6_CAEEX|nr:histone lysine demethylase PHF8 [Caerostris extrusa]
MHVDLNSFLDTSSLKDRTLASRASIKDGTLPNRNLSAPFGIACKNGNFSLKKESVYDFVDSDDDNLVPALRLRLSFNGKPLEGSFNPNSFLNNVPHSDDNNVDTPKNATIDDLLVATGLAVDGENSVSLGEDELNNGEAQLEPSTRDAIQGMLSMSKGAIRFSSHGDSSAVPIQSLQPSLKAENMSELSLPHMDSSLTNLSILARKSNPPLRNAKIAFGFSRYNNNNQSQEYDDFEEQLKQCHQDGDYIYLGLEASDDECHVFKPRGRSRRDEPWNPKAKLVPNCPKPERPVREGTRKEAIECGLAAAAAKMPSAPSQKRPFLKKKPVNRNKIIPDQQAGPSNAALNNKRPLPSEPPKVNKKPKKGFATAKQRLGKILKIHRMIY